MKHKRYTLDECLQAMRALGVQPRRKGVEWHMACPRCGGKDRCWLKAGARVPVLIGCRGCAMTWPEFVALAFGDAEAPRFIPTRPAYQEEPLPPPRSEEEAQAEADARIAALADAETHPYLQRKGVDGPCRVDPDGWLAVELFDFRRDGTVPPTPRTLQRISPEGVKRFIWGQRIAGMAHVIGRGAAIWLVEGYATGRSVKLALAEMHRSARVICCMNTSGIRRVAGMLAPADRVLATVVADCDPPKGDPLPEYGAGEATARATGLPYVMPRPAVYGDANDLHQEVDGLRRLCDALRTPRPAVPPEEKRR